MNRWRFPHVLQDAAGADGSTGGGSPDAGAAASAGAGAGAASASGGDAAAVGNGAGAGNGSALAAGAAAPGSAAVGAGQGDGAADPFAWLPEKHRVVGADGKTIDLEASARKVAEAYGHAEKRIGSGDLPPKAADDYKVNVPDGMADKIKADDLAADPMVADFKAKALSSGLTQAQFDMVVGEFLARAPALVSGAQAMDAASCEAECRKLEGWQTPEQYSERVRRAFNAGQQIFGDDFDGVLKDYGNDPRIIKGLELIGREMGEDRPAPAAAQGQIQESVDSLMGSAAYLNRNDPAHAQTVARVEALTRQLVGNRPVVGGRSHTFKTG